MYRIYLFILMVSIYACANPVRPTGGPKDTTPPKLDTSVSTPLTQTNFSDRSIKMAFDEYVVINNPAQQLIISPPLDHIPEMDTKGKSVILKLHEDDTLRENTTYSIQFNESIQDLNEGNSVKDLTYVFSTGEKIDSHKIKVQVNNPLTDGSIENVHVMLYQSLEDSIVYQSKPYYAGKTDQSGIVELQYLHEGTYKLFALKDENLNLIYDIPTEKIGFRAEPVTLPADTNFYNLALFTGEQEIALVDEICMPYGKCVFVFNSAADDYDINPLNNSGKNFSYSDRDSVIYWRTLNDIDTATLVLDSAGINIDTFAQAMPRIDSSVLEQRKFLSTRIQNVQINPIKGTEISSLRPLDSINEDKITVVDTADRKLQFTTQIDSISKSSFILTVKKAGSHKIIIEPAGLEDIYGYKLKDSLEFQLQVTPAEDLSTLICKIEGLDSTQQYIFRLKKDKNLLYEEIFSAADSTSFKYEGMKATNYTMELITDRNNNGKYNTGSYRNKQQPETIVIKEIKGMRPGWDFESDISTKD